MAADALGGVLLVEGQEHVVELGLVVLQLDRPVEEDLGGHGEELAGIGGPVRVEEVAADQPDIVVVDVPGHASVRATLDRVLAAPGMDVIPILALPPQPTVREAGAILSARVEAQEGDGLTRLATPAGPLWPPPVVGGGWVFPYLALRRPTGWAVFRALLPFRVYRLAFRPDRLLIAAPTGQLALLAYTHRADLARRPALRFARSK